MKTKLSLTEGPIFFKIFRFALPIILAGLLQICYTMADNIVVGKFSGDVNALGSVGSTNALNNLTTQLLLGLSAGASVVISQYYGAKREKDVSKAVHTALTVALLGGIFFAIVGLFISYPVLNAMGTKPELIDGALLYFRIICIGIPASAVYNYSAAILRSVGDSKSPLFILGGSGLLNVILNLIFVIGFDMTVDGVALATIISQYASAILVLLLLITRRNECYSVSRKKYCFDVTIFKRILRIGIPAGIQSSIFGLSNVLMTSAINTLPIEAIKAQPIQTNIDAVTATCCGAFSSTAMTFIGQNYGARNYKRIKKCFSLCLLWAVLITALFGLIELLFLEEITLAFIDANDPYKDAVVATVKTMCTLLLSTYFIGSTMDTISAAIKALGYSISPMLISLFCICGIRIIWIYTVFPMPEFNTVLGLFVIYPSTWLLSAIGLFCLWLYALRKTKNKLNISE